MDHSILPPSSAARRVACPGSRALEVQYPQSESQHAREGDAAHWVAYQRLVNYKIPELNSTAPNGELITTEMLEGAHLYDNAIHDIQIPDFKRFEEKISISNIHPDCWGTPDCWGFSKALATVYIWDYKFGHKPVEVFENWQLMEYAAGILNQLKLNGVEENPLMRVRFIIVQPRSFHKDGPVREWETHAVTLEPYFERLKQAEHHAMLPTAICTPNPECNYCSARHACRALQNSALTAVDISYSNSAWELTPDALGNELRILQHAAKLLEARKTGLEEEVLNKIKSGIAIPYFAIDQGNGRDCWIKPKEEIVDLGEIFGINITKPVELITPKQAIKQGIPVEIVQQYSATPKGALKLVPTNLKITRKIFEDNK